MYTLFPTANFGRLTEKCFMLEILEVFTGGRARNWCKTLLFCLTPLVKTPKISNVKHFSAKPPKLAVGNNVYMRVLKWFLLKMSHVLGNLCTLFFFTLNIFRLSLVQIRDESWLRSGIFRNLSDFDRLYLRAQMDFFHNFYFS